MKTLNQFPPKSVVRLKGTDNGEFIKRPDETWQSLGSEVSLSPTGEPNQYVLSNHPDMQALYLDGKFDVLAVPPGFDIEAPVDAGGNAVMWSMPLDLTEGQERKMAISIVNYILETITETGPDNKIILYWRSN